MALEFDTGVTAGGFLLLLVVILGGTWTSPMTDSTKMMVSGGLVVFGLVALLLGVKHGEYRARTA